jgi:hypothetical protein
LPKKDGDSSSFSEFDSWFQSLPTNNDVAKLRCIKERYKQVLDGENVQTSVYSPGKNPHMRTSKA